jgi:hypothetical protein
MFIVILKERKLPMEKVAVDVEFVYLRLKRCWRGHGYFIVDVSFAVIVDVLWTGKGFNYNQLAVYI